MTPCASNVGEPERMDAGDLIAEAVERLSASPSYRLLCAEPGMPIGACAKESIDRALGESPRWMRAGTVLADLCAHYERLDRIRPLITSEAA